MGASFLITLARRPRAAFSARLARGSCACTSERRTAARSRGMRARHARADDGRRAFLTTLAAVSFANDEIVDSRHYRPSTRFNVIIINIIFLLRTKRYLRLFGI